MKIKKINDSIFKTCWTERTEEKNLIILKGWVYYDKTNSFIDCLLLIIDLVKDIIKVRHY